MLPRSRSSASSDDPVRIAIHFPPPPRQSRVQCGLIGRIGWFDCADWRTGGAAGARYRSSRSPHALSKDRHDRHVHPEHPRHRRRRRRQSRRAARPAGDPRVARRARRRDRGRRRGPRERAGARDRRTGRDARRSHARRADDAVRQHDPGRRAGALPGRSRDRGAAAPLHPLERDGDGGAREQGQQRAGRPRRVVLVVGDAVRHRPQPLLARARAHERRRPRLLPRPFVARHLRARVPRRPRQRRAARELPPRGRRQRRSVVSASVADARLLAVRDGLDGPGPAASGVPGALHALSARPRSRRHVRPQGVGIPRRRRDRRARIARRARRWPRARSSTT